MRSVISGFGVLVCALTVCASAQATISALDRPQERVLTASSAVAGSGVVTVAWAQLLPSGVTVVMGRRVAANGTPLGTPVQLSSDGGPDAAPLVGVDATTGDAIVVWEVDGATPAVAGVRWAANGTVGTPVTLAQTAGAVVFGSIQLAMGADTATIVWALSTDSGGTNGTIDGAQWNAAAAAPAATALLSGADFAVSPAVAMGGTHATVAWANVVSPTTATVDAVRVTEGAAPSAVHAVSAAGDALARSPGFEASGVVGVGANGAGDAVIAWAARTSATTSTLKSGTWGGGSATPGATITPDSTTANLSVGHIVVTVADTTANATFTWRASHPASTTTDVREVFLPAGGVPGTEHTISSEPRADTDELGLFPQAVATPAGVTTILFATGGSVSRLFGVRVAADGTLETSHLLAGPYEYMNLAQDPGGDTVLVWDHVMACDGDIRESRWATGTTTAPTMSSVTVSTLEDAVESPIVAENAAGAGAVTYVRCAGGSAHAEVRLWPAGADLGPASALMPAGTDATAPQVGVDASGTTTVVWAQITNSGSELIEGVRIPPGGGPGAVTTISAAGADSALPVVGVTPSGDAVVLWDQYDPVAAHETVFGARWPVGAASLPGTPLRISPNDGGPTELDDQNPLLAVDPAGDAIVGWFAATDFGGDLGILGGIGVGNVTVEAVRWTGATTLSAVSHGPANSLAPSVAIDANGNAHVAWVSATSGVEDWAPGAPAPGAPTSVGGLGPVLATDGAGDTFVANADEVPAGGAGTDVGLSVRAPGGAFSAPADLSSPFAFETALAVDAAGDSVVVDRVATVDLNVNEPVEARFRLADGSICPEQRLGGIGFQGSFPSVAIDASAQADAAWVAFDGNADQLHWARVTPGCPAPASPQPPPSPPTTPVTTVPTTPLTLAKPSAPKVIPLATLLGLPSAKSCVSRRTITIHVPVHLSVKGKKVTLTKAQIELSGKVVKRLSGKHLTATISLRGLKKGTFTVTIKATTSTHSTLSATVHYKTCATKKTPAPKKKKHR